MNKKSVAILLTLVILVPPTFAQGEEQWQPDEQYRKRQAEYEQRLRDSYKEDPRAQEARKRFEDTNRRNDELRNYRPPVPQQWQPPGQGGSYQDVYKRKAAAELLWSIYSSAVSIVHELRGATSGHSANEVIDNPTFVSKLEGHIEHAGQDSRTSAVMAPALGAYQEAKLARIEFIAGEAAQDPNTANAHYKKGNAHLDQANKKLDKADFALRVLAPDQIDHPVRSKPIALSDFNRSPSPICTGRLSREFDVCKTSPNQYALQVVSIGVDAG